MDNNQEYRGRIAEVLSTVLSRPVTPEQVQDNTDLIEDIGVNSLDFLQLILKLENEFDIEIDIEKLDLGYFKQAKRLIEYIREVQEKNA
jgi:acyl carrier protein